MPSAPLSGKSSLVGDPTDIATPLLPTVVVASYKGGVWKTTLAVALAERLAWAGLRVLLVTCDDQEDARSRLGVTASDPQVARRERGEGSITVLGARDNKAIDLLYRRGPEKLGLGTYDLAVVDTPPQIKGGTLPGVLLIATVDGTDAARNLVSMLKQTPPSSRIVLVKVKRDDPDAWKQNADAIGTAAYPLARPHLLGVAQPGDVDPDAGFAPSRARRQARGVSSWTRFTGCRPSRPRTSAK